MAQSNPPEPLESPSLDENGRVIPVDHASAEEPAVGNQPISFADRVRAAVVWRSGSQIISQLLSWTTTLIVVRLLVPADYGLFAMTQVVLGLLAFLNGYGFASALIQEREVSPFRVRQAFGLLIVMNLAVAAVQLATAPLVADYYGQPVIADMLRVQALLTLSTPFIAIPEVMMGRQLDFRRQALVNLIAAASAALISVVMAWQGYGVWTLVIAPVAGFWLRAAGLAIVTRWLVWPSFDFRGTGGIAAYGSAILLIQLCWLVQTQSDIFLAGRRFSAHDIGLYSEALFLAMIFSAKFVPPLNEVAFPAYARLWNDRAELSRSFVKAAGLIMSVGLPVYTGIAASAEPLIATLFGPKWRGIVPLIEPIALGLPFLTLQILFGPALNALGKQLVTLRIALAGAVMFAACFFVASRFDMLTMAYVWLAASPLFLGLTVLAARPHLGVSFNDLAAALWRPAMAAILMAAIVKAIDLFVVEPMMLAPPLRMLGLATVGAGAYAALMLMLARDLVDDARHQLRRGRQSVTGG